jgi:hypothetical protein
MINQTVAHHKISASIGAGGMGEVFRARDTRLDREVAIKVLLQVQRRADGPWKRDTRKPHRAMLFKPV